MKKICCFFLLLAGWVFGEPPKLRLPGDVQPVRYRLDLTIVPQQDGFSGKIEIDLDVHKPTDVVWLNARDLTVDSAQLTAGGRTTAAKVQTSGTEFTGFAADAPLPAGPAQLRIAYHGAYNKLGSDGLFTQQDGGNRYVFTQFESIDARKAFPCFDEPSFKTPWQLTLHVNKTDAAVSNTPVQSETDEPDGRKKVVFAETKPLPSYLVALGVGPFDFVDAGKYGKNQTALRVITPKGKAAQAKYAAEVTGPLLVELENYFGIPYPYEKLDLLAVPLFGGAMENAGLITCVESILLRDPAQDSIGRQRSYAEVMTHEMAHQWFGDLVTTAWWDDIWLNEAFASWMESKIIRQWKPEWNTAIDEQNTRLGAMSGDSLVSARKIRQPIISNDDIANAFDNITYSKGEAVIGMFENWMGEDAFRRGVQHYIHQYAWHNATAGDFLDSLASAGSQPIGRAFSTFLDQAGVPVVSVALNCGAGAATLHLTQKRALPLGSAGSTKQLWQVPVCVRYGEGDAARRECTLLSEESADWKLPQAGGCPAWIEANADGKGYYRTRYEGDLLQKLLAGNGTHISATERVAALGDVGALTGMGEIKSGDALDLAMVFADDPVRQVVDYTAAIIGGVHDHLLPSELRPNYARVVDRAFGARTRQLGWQAKPGDDAETKLLRASIVPFVAQWGSDGSLAAEARRLAVRWLADRSAIDPEMAGSVLGAAARSGDEAFFKQLQAELPHTQDRHQRELILSAMGSFSDPQIARAAMELALKPDIDLRESAAFFFGPLGAPETRDLPFEFVKTHYEAIAARIPAGSTFGFGDALPFVGTAFCDEKSAAEVKAFFEPKVDRFPGTRRNLDQVLETIRICTAIKAAQQESATEFLKKY
ncbi:MAG TPA: M1 family metallopeptidase [Bryobacteraceae bacterium]|jgi:alanyl aminopeptidase|nr:M1 family metallopeptidase [Bryobacteraceae bacterium]